MKVINKIKVYEVNGEDVKTTENIEIEVLSYWNRDMLVLVKVGSDTYTVIASELEKAISNATNHK